MAKYQITKTNYGSIPSEEDIVDKILTFENADIDISSENISIKMQNNVIHTYKLSLLEQDSLFLTFEGKFENGIAFRLIRFLPAPNTFSFGSLFPYGYGVYFEKFITN